AFGARQRLVGDSNRLAQRAPDALEARFDHVVRILPGDLHVDGGAERLGKRAEEMRGQLRRERSDRVAAEAPLEHAIGAPGKIDRDLCERLIHRQQESITVNAPLVAEGALQSLAQRQRAILDRMVLVDVQVALAGQLHREAAVLGDLLQHVIEEDRKSTRLNSSHVKISYAVFCLKK